MKKLILIGLIIFLIINLSGCTLYEPDKNNILKHFSVNENYKIVSVESNFVSGNECMWFVNITIQNKTSNEFIYLNDFNYDDCEDKLYYGWYKEKNLPEKYGIIL